jgi:negative regulator of replication initiation
MNEPTYTFRSRNQDGTLNEVEVTPDQALNLNAGRAMAYWARDEKTLVNDHGEITHYESAIPETPDE